MVIDPSRDTERFRQILKDALESDELALIVARRPCLLAAGKIKQYEEAARTGESCSTVSAEWGKR